MTDFHPEEKQDLYLPLHCIVPLSVRQDKTIPAEAKIYAGELNVLSNKFGYCFASDEQLAEMKEVDVRTIKRWNTLLEKGGHIRRDTHNIMTKDQEDDSFHWRKKRRIYMTFSNNFSERDKNVPSNERDKNVPYKYTTGKEDNNAAVNPPKEESPNRENHLLQEKAELLRQRVPALASDNILVLCKNSTLDALEKATAHLKTQTDIKNPFKWLLGCIKGKWWEDAEEEIKQLTLYDAFKKAILEFWERNDIKETIITRENFIHACTQHGGQTILPEMMNSPEKCKKIADYITNSFNLRYKLVYVKLPGRETFEVME